MPGSNNILFSDNYSVCRVCHLVANEIPCIQKGADDSDPSFLWIKLELHTENSTADTESQSFEEVDSLSGSQHSCH